ncbi:MAG: CPBP family intramembrane metalloprotease [Candidatus Eremiobacteraeota bacterium]|nr:CPBP family intramembrane metalloprotease [Candidatus Eremiobacteraeota bacterium]
MTAFVIFVAAMFVLTVAAGLVSYRQDGRIINPLWYTWSVAHIVEIVFTTPAIVAAIRGRRLLKSILLGQLSIIGLVVIGLGAGFACVFFSTIVGLSYYEWPTFRSSGALEASGALPITAYLLGPFGEEMLYQGGLQTWLQRFGPVIAVVGATFPFWSFHLYGGFVPMRVAFYNLLPSMIAFAVIRQSTKSLGAAVLAHSTYNVLVSFLVFVPRNSY